MTIIIANLFKFKMETEQPSILNISASIGFNNYTKDSLCIHPSDLHLIWA